MQKPVTTEQEKGVREKENEQNCESKHTENDVIDSLEVRYVAIIEPNHSSDAVRIVKPGEG